MLDRDKHSSLLGKSVTDDGEESFFKRLTPLRKRENKGNTKLFKSNFGKKVRLSVRRRDSAHNDTQQNDTQHNDTQRNDTQYNDTQYNDTQHNDTQHNKTQ
jgi:hypothetical protein